MQADFETLLKDQFEFRRDPELNASSELSVVILKPGFTDEHVAMLGSFAASSELELVHQQAVLLGQQAVLAIYNDIFRFSNNDILFGLDWKDRKLRYMTSSESNITVLQGRNAFPLCKSFKYAMRAQFGKLSVPEKPLSDEEFEELAIKNILHVVDGAETEIALWLLARTFGGGADIDDIADRDAESHGSISMPNGTDLQH